jgi:hypothetical protein
MALVYGQYSGRPVPGLRGWSGAFAFQQARDLGHLPGGLGRRHAATDDRSNSCELGAKMVAGWALDLLTSNRARPQNIWEMPVSGGPAAQVIEDQYR